MRARLAAGWRSWLVGRGACPAPRELASSAIVFAPHPDDETLGCGGTIAIKRDARAPVVVAFLTDGERSHAALSRRDLGVQRRREAVAAARELGVAEHELHFFGFPDGELARLQDRVSQSAFELLAQVRPREMYVPHRLDGPLDHQAAARAVLDAARYLGKPLRVYEYPVWLWNNFPWVAPRWRGRGVRALLRANARAQAAFLTELRCVVPTASVLARKRRALGCYVSQTRRLETSLGWSTLHDVSEGEWLRTLLGEQEFYRRYDIC